MRDHASETELPTEPALGMGDLRADRQGPTVTRRRPIRKMMCRMLGHVRVPAIDEWELVYVRCRSCRMDLTLEA